MVKRISTYPMKTDSYTAKISIFVFSFVLFFSNAQATLTASVDRNPVTINESFTFILESNESVNDEPDFSVLQSDFDILNKQQSSNFQMINGSTSRSIQWHVTLIPKHSGLIEIPAIKVDSQQSQSLRLMVKEGPNVSSTDNNKDLFLKIETDSENIYVQQQLLYTTNLYYALDSGLNLAQGSTLSEPELESGDAVIKKLGKDKDFQTRLNGRPYRVIQRRYAVFPQQSGKIKFKPVIFEGHMSQQSRNRFRMFDPYQKSTRIKRIQSEAITLDIKAIPSQFNGKTWLPASNVQLVEDWPEVKKDWYAGEPLTRTLGLFVDGLTSAQLPMIRANIPADVKQYPDQPIIKDTVTESGFSGIRQEKIALIPSHAGNFTFPPVKIHWWNTETGKQETANLPARTVKILPPKISTNSSRRLPVTPATEPMIMPTPSTNMDESDNSLITPLPLSTSIAANWWPWIALLLASGWLLTVIAWWKQQDKTSNREKPAKTTNNSKKQFEKQIKQACNNNNAAQAKQALLDWAAYIWPEHKPVSLGSIVKQVDKEFSKQLQVLNQSLYSKEQNSWDGAMLWKTFKNQAPDKNKANKNETLLAPLFPG